MCKVMSYRKFTGLTQFQMSEKLGISISSYRNKEKGRTAFTDREKSIVKEILLPYFSDITIDEIFFGEK